MALNAAAVAATGLQVSEHKMLVHTNNMSRKTVSGAKADVGVYVENPPMTLRSAGAASGTEGEVLPTGLQVGMGARVAATSKIMTNGMPRQTDATYDLAIVGPGYFHIAKDGGTVYTRDGHFQLDANRQIVTLEGHIVQPGLTIPENASEVEISQTGVVTASLADGTSVEVGTLTLMKFSNPSGLHSIGGNYFVETEASGPPTEGNPGGDFGTVLQGYVEDSNIHTSTEMVGLMEGANTSQVLSIAMRKIFEVDKATQQMMT